MKENVTNSKAGQGLGIAGFVLGAVALIICWIPCIGMWAFFPGIVGIILSAIALSQAARGGNTQKGLIIAALVLSVIGTGASVYQYFVLRRAANTFTNELQDFGKEWEESMQKMESDTNAFSDLEDALNDMKDELENSAEEMNKELSEFNTEEWDKKIDDEKFDEILNDYEKMVQSYVDFVKKAEKGDLTAITSYMNIATKLSILSMKLAAVMPKLSQEQIDRFNEIDEKYKEYLKN